MNHTSAYTSAVDTSQLPKPGHWIFRGDGFFFGLGEYLASENGKRVAAVLHEPRYTLKETDLTYRVVNHWDSEGLIDSTRAEEKGWRRFSLLDVVWLHVLMELRLFGLSLEKLLRAKHSLRQKRGENGTELFEYYVALALLRKEPVYLLVFRDGTGEMAYDEQYQMTLEFFPIANHVRIEINPILQRLFPKLELGTIREVRVQLADDEMEVLQLIRSGRFESVTVKRKNGRIERIEAEETVEAQRRIAEILQDADFQDISVKKENGRVVSIKRTIKKKV